MDFLASIVGEEVRAVEKDYGNGYVRLAISEAARRQAKHDIRSVEDVVLELLRNARDAHARTIYVATGSEGHVRRIVMIDDGDGIAREMWEQIFQPRVTGKLETMHMDEWGVHGRGMALYSIKENTRLARVYASDIHGGTIIGVEIDTEVLSQKADQSSWPEITHVAGETKIRGPRNVIRTLVEFACAHPEIVLFYGSLSEVVCSLHDAGDDDREDPEGVTSFIRGARSAFELAEAADSCGLPISERSAYRIISGQVSGALPVHDRIRETENDVSPLPIRTLDDLEKDVRGLKIAADDLQTFANQLERAFDELADKYYLELRDHVKLTQNGDSFRAIFTFDKH